MSELQVPKKSYLILLLTIVTLHCYWNSLNGDFLSDDIILVTRNYDIRSLSNIPSLFTRDYFGAGHNDKIYRPIIHLSLALNYYFGGLNTFGYHLVNLILHLLNGLLVYRLTLHYTEGRDIAFLNSLFFLAHPVRTEAVTWVSGRSELLSAFFFLACWLAFTQLKRGRYIVTSILFLLALFSKESTAILPAVILMTEFYKSYSWDGLKHWLSERIASYAIFLFPLSIYILARLAALGTLTVPNTSRFFKDMGLETRLCTMATGFLHYFKLLVWPATLCFDYDFSVIPRQDGVTTEVAISIVVVLSILLLGVILVRKQPIISYAILFFFVTIFIVSNIVVPIGILISERVLYIPAISIGLILAHLLSMLYRRQERALQVLGVILTCAIIVPASVRCVERNKDWQNAKSYGEAYVRDTPGNIKGRFVRAAVFESEGRLQEAEQEYRLAVMLSPNLSHTHSALGTFLYQQKRYQEAFSSIQRALELNTDVEALVIMGKLLKLQGDYQSALNYLLKAAELSPDNIPLYSSLASTLQQLGRHEEAMKYLHRVLELEPERVDAHLSLAISLEAIGQKTKATEQVVTAIRLNPDYGPARYQHALLLLNNGEIEHALEEFLTAMNKGVDTPELHNNLGIIYAEKGQIDQARQEFNTALRMCPSYEVARKNLEQLAK